MRTLSQFLLWTLLVSNPAWADDTGDTSTSETSDTADTDVADDTGDTASEREVEDTEETDPTSDDAYRPASDWAGETGGTPTICGGCTTGSTTGGLFGFGLILAFVSARSRREG
mgnify:CR=1 FL=1